MSGADEERVSVCVVDASVLVKLFVPEDGSEAAVALLRSETGQATLRLVPDLVYLECANVLWKMVKRGMLTGDLARESLSDLVELPLQVRPSLDVAESAFDLADELNITAYDAAYLALALSMDAPLVTADAALVRKAGRYSGQVRLLSDL